jgi:ketosteroid isomerase-like protein
VARWVQAHNDRDLDGMLACATQDVEFHPLRLTGGSADVYVGQEGLRLWFNELARSTLGHELRIEQVRDNGHDEVLLIGTVEVPGRPTVAEFYGVYDVSNGLISRAHHYLSDRRTMEELGIIRPS